MAKFNFISTLGQFLRTKHAKNFEKATLNPKEAQFKKLKNILEKNANTEFGKKHGFWRINSIKDYQENIGINTHSELKPYLDKMIKGEKNVLTYQEPIYYGMTTGSSGTPKLTPITPDYRDEYQTVVHTFLYHAYKAHPNAFLGKALYFNGSAGKVKTETGIDCGTMSGFNFRNLPKIVQKVYALPYEVSVIDDSFARFYCMVLLSIPQDITLMVAITGAPILSFVNALMNQTENLIKDLHDGTLNQSLNLTNEERELVKNLHKANPILAKNLESIYKSKGKLYPTDVWKNLDLIMCWKGSSAGVFINDLEKYFKGISIRDAIYSATEGWCNIPYSDNVLGGPLAITAHFYEFIEENDDTNKILLTHELEIGKKYRILYTTSGGMYRYDIGDILEVTEMYNNTPSVKFVRKVGQSCNIVGELMSVNHVNEAIEKTFSKFNIRSNFYCLVPVYKVPPHYTLLIEFVDEIDNNTKQEFAKFFDKSICELNLDYESFRDDKQLGQITLSILEKGSLDVFKKQQVRLGADEAQIKPIGLAQNMDKLSDLKIIEEI